MTTKILLLLLVFLTSLSTPLAGATTECSQFDIELHSQDEVDNFQVNYGNGSICNTVLGYLGITGDDITNLDGLSDLIAVNWDLSIFVNPMLSDVQGLSGLGQIGGSLGIRENPALEDLSGLSGLTKIEWNVWISDNDALTDLQGLLTSISHVEGDVIIERNNELSSLEGLNGLQSTGGYLQIMGHPKLTSLASLAGLTVVGGWLVISDNDALMSLEGLTSVSTVNGGLHIHDNDALTSLEGLTSVTNIGSLIVRGNDALISLAGLASVKTMTGGLEIAEQPNLVDIDPLTSLPQPLQLEYLELSKNSSLLNLDGLNGLTYIAGETRIFDNDMLNDLTGLSNVTGLGRGLYVSGNASLTDMSGLDAIGTIGTSLGIWSNPVLTSLSGLSSLTGVGDGVSILSNPALSNCSALARLMDDVDDPPPGPGPGTAGVPDVGGAVVFYDNASYCNSIHEVDFIHKSGFESIRVLSKVDDPPYGLGHYTSLAIGLDDFPVIAYQDFTSGLLKVAKCNDRACAGQNEIISTVDGLESEVGRFASLAVGGDGFPVISYFDDSSQALKVAKCNDAACSGGDETITTLDDASNSVGQFTSMAIGVDGFPIISYIDQSAGALKVAKCNDQACLGDDESITTVEDTANTLNGQTSIEIGMDGFPVISYSDVSADVLKVVKCNDPACADGNETITVVDDLADEFPNQLGHHSSLAIGQDGFPIISYVDRNPNVLKVVKCANEDCSGTGLMISVLVEDGEFPSHTSIAMGTDGFPVISYSANLIADALIVIKCNDIACSGGNEFMTAVDTSPIFYAIDFPGHFSSASMGADGIPIISYYEPYTESLKTVHCGTPSCR